MGTYKNKDMQVLFNISPDTVRVWSEEFHQYLSPMATPGTGKHRTFNDEDLRVFALIAQQRDQGFDYESIHAALRVGARGELPDVTDERALTQHAELQLTLARDMVVRLESQLRETEERAKVLHDENIRLQTSEKHARDLVEQVAKERDAAQSEIQRLQRELGKLEAKLEILQEQKGDE